MGDHDAEVHFRLGIIGVSGPVWRSRTSGRQDAVLRWIILTSSAWDSELQICLLGAPLNSV